MRKVLILLCLLCLFSLPVLAAEDSRYCFSPQDFPDSAGICLTELPKEGNLLLGSRILRAGDVLTCGQAGQMIFEGAAQEASVRYRPIRDGHVQQEQAAVFSLRGRDNQPPTAQDSAAETYKNLPNTALLRAEDPEGEAMTFTLVRQPRRGSVTLSPDGSFTYTPKKNKVGVDSFTYQAEDPQGNQSREATVTVTILKPTEVPQYQDTMSVPQAFAAEWMKNTGIFVGETLDGKPCFQPDKPVSRGEFLTMLVKTMEIPPEETILLSEQEDVPFWLRPYLAAAVRWGLTADIPDFGDMNAPVSGGEAGVLLKNALSLETAAFAEDSAPWAYPALSVLAEKGIVLDGDAILTRGQAGEILYAACQEKNRR